MKAVRSVVVTDPIAMLLDAVSDYVACETMNGRSVLRPEIRVNVGAPWTVEVRIAGQIVARAGGSSGESAARLARSAFVHWVERPARAVEAAS